MRETSSMTRFDNVPVEEETWGEQAVDENFHAGIANDIHDTYVARSSRFEVRDDNFKLLAVHWSARNALGDVGERMARGEKAAVYLAQWHRIESEYDPRLKERS